MTPLSLRRPFFDDYPEKNRSSIGKYGVRFTCPCCGYPTLLGRSSFEVCFLCSWEDDGQDDSDAEENHGGPNHGYTLAHARLNFESNLIMYDPENNPTISGEDTPAELREKEKAVTAFEAMLSTPTADHESLWHQVLSAQRELYSLLKEAIRRYERRA